MEQSLRKKYQMIILFLIMVCAGAVLIYRAFRGLDITDETFYLATARRFYDGDMLFKYDWNTGQIFGLLMLPFYRMYIFFHGNAEGIILSCRILFVILGLFVSCFLFRVMFRCTESFGASIIASLCVLVYVRGNIITISYYSLGFYSFLLTILWWMEAECLTRKETGLVLSGINFAVSVLCMPYMIVLFGLILVMGVYWKVKHDTTRTRQLFWWMAGIFLSAFTFLIYFRNLIPWPKLLEYIPLIFQDPEMENVGILEQFRTLFFYILTVFLKYTWPVYVLTFIISFLKGRNYIKSTLIKKYFPWILLLEFFVQSIYVRSYFESGIIITFLLFMLQLQFLYPQCRTKCLEKCFAIPGVMFGFVWVLGSNVGERVINMSFLLVDLWAISFLWKICQKQKTKVHVLMKIPAYLMFLVLFIIRLFDVYGDGSVSRLTYQISSGAMKGIYTEEHRGIAYEQTVEILHSETTEDNVIAVLGCNSWVYIDSAASCGAYTTWNLNSGENLLEQYYEMFPEKIPDVILIVPENLDLYESWKFSSHGAGVHMTEQPSLEGVLQKLVEEEDYDCLEKNGAILYKKF